VAYHYIKAIHIIFVISWMAGLFYIVRLFVYHTEAKDKPEPARSILHEQFMVMERLLWRVITTPAMILTLASGAYMLFDLKWYEQPWMHVKLLFVAGLLVYHFICQGIIQKLKAGTSTWTSTQLRLWNELATLFMVAIVFVVILKNSMDWIKGTLGYLLLGVVLMIAVKAYKRYRQRKAK
jgi:protoporphyrinogen IX oxidase